MRNYLLGLYEKSMPNHLSIREKLSIARESDFDFLELSVDETDEKLARLNWTPEERSRVRQAVEATGVPIGSICLSAHRKFPLGDPDPAIRARSLEIMAQAIDLAVNLGARIIQLAGYDVYYKESTPKTQALFASNLKHCVELASAKGVMLAFETMETPFLDTVEKAMHWVAQIPSPYLQVYPDAGNITNANLVYGGDIADDLRKGRGHIAALHLKETRPGIYREVPYGTGHVDFDAVTKAAFSLGVRRYLAEFWYTGQTCWREDIAANARFLRKFLDQNQ